MPVARGEGRGGRVDPSFAPGTLPPAALTRPTGGGGPVPLEEFARRAGEKPGDLGKIRDEETEKRFDKGSDKKPEEGKEDDLKALSEAKKTKELLDRARDRLNKGDKDSVQTGKDGVDLALASARMREQSRLDLTALRDVQGRRLMEIGGVWLDDGFNAKTNSLTVKAQSDAYFKLLEKHPELKDVLRLGNYLVWIAPSGTALIIDAKNGKSELSDKEIEQLFKAKK
jgi:Ca-activated chloride channel family protein